MALPSVSLFCVSVPVLSAHKISTPASSSIATNRLTTACFLARRRAPTAIVTDRTVGIATGYRCDGQHERELQGGENRIPPVDGKSDDDPNQADGEDDEIVANLQEPPSGND